MDKLTSFYLRKRPGVDTVMERQIHMGQMVSSDKLGLSLHDTARKGQKKALKQILKRGIAVDYPNDEGQTALFCACCENKSAAAQVLLKAGGNPNERSNQGMTPLHMACYTGNIGLLVKLIEAGGDLRLHDYAGRSPKDWATANPEPKRRLKMLEFLDKSHMFAVTHSGKDLLSSAVGRDTSGRVPSFIQMIKKKVGIDPALHIDPLKRVQSMGFGSVYLAGEAQGAVVSVIPVVSENSLYHDGNGVTYENGSFLVMESMTWNNTAVTVKRLHKQAHPGGYVDVLISEMEQMGKIRHPNILLLMGVCQTTSLDSIVLVYERVGLGSLYYYLHQRIERLPTQNIQDIMLQICGALTFLHSQGYIHCNLSSHAISLVTPFCAKLANFEHMIDSQKADMGKQSAVTQVTFQNALYNWMAPELMSRHPATFLCDVYSYSCILWEMFECEVPWDMCDSELIKHKLLVEKQQLPVESTKMPPLFRSIVNIGTQLDPYDRTTDFEKIHKWLLGHPDHPISKMGPSVESSPGKRSTGRQSKPHSNASSPAKRSLKQQEASAPYMEEYSPDSKHKKSYRNANHHNRYSPDYGRAGKGNRVRIVENAEYEKRDRRQGRETNHDFIPMSAENKDWVCQVERNREGDYYSYSAKVRKDGASPSRYSPYDDNTLAKKYMVESDSASSDEDCETMRKYSHKKKTADRLSYHEDEDRGQRSNEARGSPLSPSKFSYLKLCDTTNTGGQSVVKPASHCTEAGCPKTSGQVTTAGSLFALYNSGTDLNELTKRATGLVTSQCSSTFPRNQTSKKCFEEYEAKNKSYEVHNRSYEKQKQKRSQDRQNKSYDERRSRRDCDEEEGDPNWFGGKGSVKNLVHLYQEQADTHDFQQKVLEGKVVIRGTAPNSRSQSPERFVQQYSERSPSPPRHKGLEYQQFVEAGGSYSKHEDNTAGKYPVRSNDYSSQRRPERYYDQESDSQCSNVSYSSSSPSDQIKKAKAAVARERALEYQREKDEDSSLMDEIMEEMTKCRNYKQKRQQFLDSGDISRYRGKQEFDMKEYYIDDDISTDDDRSHIKLQGNTELGTRTHHRDWKHHRRSMDKDSRRGKESLKKVGKKYKHDSILSKPKAITRPMMMSASQKDEPASKGFTTTVTVESSLVNPGEHHLRHMTTDLATGQTKVLHQETVNASTLRSTLEA